MLKRDELADPTSCLNRARDDEMTFVLLGRDAAAPAAIRAWAEERIRLGKFVAARTGAARTGAARTGAATRRLSRRNGGPVWWSRRFIAWRLATAPGRS